MANVLANIFLFTRSAVPEKQSVNHLEFCFCPPIKYQPNIHSSFAPFLVSNNTWGKCLALKLPMRRYVHQLVLNCVCLLFGAEQVVHKLFLSRPVSNRIANFAFPSVWHCFHSNSIPWGSDWQWITKDQLHLNLVYISVDIDVWPCQHTGFARVLTFTTSIFLPCHLLGCSTQLENGIWPGRGADWIDGFQTVKLLFDNMMPDKLVILVEWAEARFLEETVVCCSGKQRYEVAPRQLSNELKLSYEAP